MSFSVSKLDQRYLDCLDAEYFAAQAQFPTNEDNFVALVEEVGELAQALIDHKRGKQTAAQVFKEAIQVGNMAIRVAMEGSAEYPYQFTHQCYQQYKPNKLITDTEEVRSVTKPNNDNDETERMDEKPDDVDEWNDGEHTEGC